MSSLNIPCPACGAGLKIRDRKLLGRVGKCPKCGHRFPLEEPSEVTLELAAAPPALGPIVAVPPESIGSLRTQHKRNTRGRWINAIIGLLVVAAVGGAGYYVWTQPPEPRSHTASSGDSTATSSETAGGDVIAEGGITARPTQGDPILLEMIPAGPRVLLHLRPAELWQPDSLGEEFRFCLGPLGQFLEAKIKELCFRPPQEIEEVLFAWIPGERGTAPDLATVVRLKADVKKSELLDVLGGQQIDTNARSVYLTDKRAALILDLKTYAIGPPSMADEIASSVGGQNPMPAGIEDLVRKTDRKRHITLLFEPTAVLLDKEFLAPAGAQTLLTECMDWFGDDAEAVLWSMHLEEDRFYSEVQIRTATGVRTKSLEDDMRKRLDGLASELVATVRYMQPAEQGKRQLIGRVPAMAKVYAMATVADHDSRHVRFVTPLPDRAAPNLALGTLLAWDESTRTDFNRTLAPPTSTPPKATLSIAERLKQKIDFDFRRTPLQEAFAYIADETKVTIDIDGDALKLAGCTQNIPQTFKLDQVPVSQGIQEIFKTCDKMCVVVDESKGTILVTTFSAAEQRGLTPFKFGS